MAASLAWGLAFATVLTLFIIPALFSIVDDVRRRFGRLDIEGDRQPDTERRITAAECDIEDETEALND